MKGTKKRPRGAQGLLLQAAPVTLQHARRPDCSFLQPTNQKLQESFVYCTFSLKTCRAWYPSPTLTLTLTCFRLFSQDNVSSLSHEEINTGTWVLALSICSARLELLSQRCRAGCRGNNFPITAVITLGSYHYGCLAKKS